MVCAFSRVLSVAFSSLLIPLVLLLLSCSDDGQAFVLNGGGGGGRNLEWSSSSSTTTTFSWPFDEHEEARLPRSCSNHHFQTLMFGACGLKSSKRSVRQQPPSVPPILMNLLIVEYYFAPALTSSSVHPQASNMQHQMLHPSDSQQQPIISNHVNGVCLCVLVLSEELSIDNFENDFCFYFLFCRMDTSELIEKRRCGRHTPGNSAENKGIHPVSYYPRIGDDEDGALVSTLGVGTPPL